MQTISPKLAGLVEWFEGKKITGILMGTSYPSYVRQQTGTNVSIDVSKTVPRYMYDWLSMFYTNY
jgi:hypothetical protein